jgi:hypothetical protein
MAKTEVPLEKDYKHWKELYEMAQRKHATEITKWQETATAWQHHALTLGATISRLLSTSR